MSLHFYVFLLCSILSLHFLICFFFPLKLFFPYFFLSLFLSLFLSASHHFSLRLLLICLHSSSSFPPNPLSSNSLSGHRALCREALSASISRPAVAGCSGGGIKTVNPLGTNLTGTGWRPSADWPCCEEESRE